MLMFFFTTTAQVPNMIVSTQTSESFLIKKPEAESLHTQVGTRTAEGPGWTARAVPMDRRPQPEARGGDERSEGERRADAVAAGAHRLLPGARHRKRVRPGQAVP